MTLTQKNDIDFKKEYGVVYTPPSLSSFVAKKVTECFLSDQNEKGTFIDKEIKVLDPACGEGELLLAMWRSFSRANVSVKKSFLYGLDIDADALIRTQKSLHQTANQNVNLLNLNALFPRDKKRGIEDWESIMNIFNVKDGFDIIIANPPWGADLSKYRDELTDSDYKLKRGQFDSSDLFIELALSQVKNGGYIAFIIPDSLFSFEKKSLRKMLVEQTEIKYIARLGEKIFEGVNRACSVIVCKKSAPQIDHEVVCMRLNPQVRKSILSGKMTYDEADKKLNHKIPQTRFSEDKELIFDIDTHESDRKIVNKLTVNHQVIGDYVTSSRGVELSKSGKVYKCEECSYWNPHPNVNTKIPKCNHCGAKTDLQKVEKRSIISKIKHAGYKPLLVGESIRRYSISPQYWISLDNEGINYKNISTYYEPKIIVRKTGVGITASIDYSNSLTNQVVYMFRPRTEMSSVPIELVLAIMNSRAMYFYLLKRFGETEWRSHPYLTQTQILNLPMPDLLDEKFKAVRKDIVTKVKKYLEKGQQIPRVVDAEVERLVASLYGLTKKDYETIYSTLGSIEGLIPVKVLTDVTVQDIFD